MSHKNLPDGFTIAFSVGRWGGFWWLNGFTRVVTLGWFFLMLIPRDLQPFLGELIDLAQLPVSPVLIDSVFFAYSHGQITEGAGMELLKLDRLEFRERWIAYLRANREVARATGHDVVFSVKQTEET